MNLIRGDRCWKCGRIDAEENRLIQMKAFRSYCTECLLAFGLEKYDPPQVSDIPELDLSGVMEELNKIDWDKVNRERRARQPRVLVSGGSVQVNVKW